MIACWIDGFNERLIGNSENMDSLYLGFSLRVIFAGDETQVMIW